LFYLQDGTAVDANGVPLEGAPERPEDTKPEDQPHAKLLAATTVGAGGAPSSFDFKALGSAIAEGLTQAAGRAAANAEAVDAANKKSDEIYESAKDVKPKEGATPIVTGSATAELNQGPPSDAALKAAGVERVEPTAPEK